MTSKWWSQGLDLGLGDAKKFHYTPYRLLIAVRPSYVLFS